MNSARRILAVCGMVQDCYPLAHGAAMIARGLFAELYIMAVIYNPFGIRGLSFPRPSLAEDYRKLVERTRNDLREMVDREKQHTSSIQAVIREGKPLNEILSFIREKNIDLLVVPAHEEGWLESLLSSRTNQELLRRLPCSILYIKTEPVAIEEEEEEGAEEAA